MINENCPKCDYLFEGNCIIYNADYRTVKSKCEHYIPIQDKVINRDIVFCFDRAEIEFMKRSVIMNINPFINHSSSAQEVYYKLKTKLEILSDNMRNDIKFEGTTK